ncbi:hypothetical protein NVP1063O_043 [Vibrio phage 1.063.O._10N.261.45.C7]|nr:hypothetical protein NVP1063O_043 [Vibrio phage 1.063.O._10N.261.45.C7]
MTLNGILILIWRLRYKDNKTIAKLLRKAVKESEYQSNRWGKMNGFDCIVGEETKVSAEKLVTKVGMISDMLEEV